MLQQRENKVGVRPAKVQSCAVYLVWFAHTLHNIYCKQNANVTTHALCGRICGDFLFKVCPVGQTIWY